MAAAPPAYKEVKMESPKEKNNEGAGAPISTHDGLTCSTKYKEVLFRLGIAEITTGAISVLLAIIAVALAASTNYSYSYHYQLFYGINYYTYYDYVNDSLTFAAMGVWSGLVAVAAGLFWMVMAKKDQSIRNYRISMGLAVVGATLFLISVLMSVLAAAWIWRREGLKAVHALMVVVDFAGVVICIIHSLACGPALGFFSDKYIEGVLSFIDCVVAPFAARGMCPAKCIEGQQVTTVAPRGQDDNDIETAQHSDYPRDPTAPPAEPAQACANLPVEPLEKVDEEKKPHPTQSMAENGKEQQSPLENPPSYKESQQSQQQ